MGKRIRVLYVDDYALDRELVRDALTDEQSKFDLIEAASREDFLERLPEGKHDIVLSDFNILGFEGLDVIDAVRRQTPDVPVIIVTGTGSEEVAVEAMKRGAADYVIKTADRIRRLPHTIHAVLGQQQLRHERRQAEEALRESERRYRLITESITDYVYTNHVVDGRPNRTAHGQACEIVTGYTPQEFLDDWRLWLNRIPEEDHPLIHDMNRRIESNNSAQPVEHRFRRKDGAIRWFRNTPVPQYDASGTLLTFDGLIQDISERKQAEEALRESEERLRFAQRIAQIGNWSWEIAADRAEWSDQVYEIFKAERKPPSHAFARSFVHPNDLDRWESTVQRAVKEQKPFAFDYRAVRSDGRMIWVHNETRAVFDERGQLTGYLGTVQDITQRKKAEEALREGEEKFRSFVENANDIVYTLSLDGRFTYVSPNAADLLGYPPEVVVGQSLAPFIHPDDLAACRAFVREVISTGERRGGIEYRVKHTNGTWQWHTTNAAPIKNEQGTVLAFLGISRDITDRKRVEEAYRKLVEHSPYGIALVQDSRIVHTNPAFAAMTGYSVAELLDMLPEAAQGLKHPSDRDRVLGYYRSRLSGRPAPAQYEYRLVRKDGAIRWVDVSVDVVEYQGRPAVQVFYADITERKEAQDALCASEGLYRTTIDAISDAVHVVDRDLRICLFNASFKTWCEQLGLSADVVGRELLDVFPFLDDKVREEYRRVFDTGRPVATGETAGINGETFITEITKTPIFEGGEVARVLTVVRDVTERRRAEAAIREKAFLLDASSAIIGTCDLNGRMTYANTAFLDQLGVNSLDEVLGRHFTEFWMVQDQFEEIMETLLGASGPGRWVGEPELRRNDGTAFDAHVAAATVLDPSGKPTALMSTSIDITERKQAEDRLRRSRERLRVLTRRIEDVQEAERRRLAHDLHDHVGQVLSTLGLSLSLTREKARKETPEVIQKHLDASLRQGEEMGGAIRSVMSDLRPSVLDDYGVLAALQWCAERFAGHNGIEVHVDGSKQAPRLSPRVETGLFRIAQEALNNVAKHAQADNVAITLQQTEALLRLTIADDGCGFDTAAAAGRSEKAGWGLMTMRERAAAIGGTLRIESAPDEGTRVIAEIGTPPLACRGKEQCRRDK